MCVKIRFSFSWGFCLIFILFDSKTFSYVWKSILMKFCYWLLISFTSFSFYPLLLQYWLCEISLTLCSASITDFWAFSLTSRFLPTAKMKAFSNTKLPIGNSEVGTNFSWPFSISPSVIDVWRCNRLHCAHAYRGLNNTHSYYDFCQGSNRVRWIRMFFSGLAMMWYCWLS